MTAPQFVDISAWQPLNIDWAAYKAWSAAGDGISRVSLRSSYGTGFVDAHYHAFRTAAEQAGIDVIIHYHYSYPNLNNPQAEADWQRSVVGTVRPNDVLMLDYEENVPQANAAWALAWLERQEANYGGKLPTIYASDAYVRAHLQDARLARFPLTLANWTFNPSARPACPPPWQHYDYLQYTDRATSIPGVPGAVDANIYIGGHTVGIPQGWHEETVNGQIRLVCPNGHYAIDGFREWILGHAWDPANVLLGEEFHAAQVLLHNASVGAGSVLLTRDGMLWWTQARGVVWEPYLGLEIKACYDLIASQQAEIAVLKAQPPTPTPQPALNLADAIATLQGLETDVAGKLAQALKDLGA